MKNLNLLTAFLLTLIYYLVSQALSFTIFISDLIDYNSYPELWNWSLTLSELFSQFVLFCLVLYYFRVSKFTVKENDFVFSLPLLILTILSGFFIVYIQEPLNYLFQYLPGLDEFHGFNKDVDEFKLFYIPQLISSILLVPIIEELFFRKLIFRNIVNTYTIIIAILFSSFLFAIIHLPDIQQTLITFLGGLIAAYLFYKSSYNIPKYQFSEKQFFNYRN